MGSGPRAWVGTSQLGLVFQVGRRWLGEGQCGSEERSHCKYTDGFSHGNGSAANADKSLLRE